MKWGLSGAGSCLLQVISEPRPAGRVPDLSWFQIAPNSTHTLLSKAIGSIAHPIKVEANTLDNKEAMSEGAPIPCTHISVSSLRTTHSSGSGRENRGQATSSLYQNKLRHAS